MNNLTEINLPLCKAVLAEIEQFLSNREEPIVVAIDGGSGSGKSTLVLLIECELDSAVIPLDDFFSADIPDNQWDHFAVEDKLRNVFDWNRLINQVIEPLLKGKTARWHAFDFESGLRADGTYGMLDEITEREPAEVILIEGAYSASPELAAYVDLSILVDLPVDKRHIRLRAREDKKFLQKWHKRWDEVEEYYFTQVRPKSTFDFVVKIE